MTNFTKAQFEIVSQQARQAANLGEMESAMCITMNRVNSLDLALARGKYVEELRNLAYHYERMCNAGTV